MAPPQHTYSGVRYMRYQVRFVADESLPGDVEFAFVRQAGQACLFVKQSAIDTKTGTCDALTRAWSLWQSLGDDGPPRVSVKRFAPRVPSVRAG